jgi:DNA polymerase III epsilon subunit-like protein
MVLLSPMEPTIIFFDTETTGLTPDGRLIQLAYHKKGDSYKDMFNEYYKAPVPITHEAMAIHHIKQKDVENKDPFQESGEYDSIKALFEDENTYIVAHNATFDADMLSRENIHATSLIDTVKIAHHLDPKEQLKQKNLQYLRYALSLDDDTKEEIIPHDAKSDVIILHLLFERLFAKMRIDFETDKETLDEMIKISKEPLFIRRIAFGKYKDRLLEEIAKEDPGYLQWLLNQKRQSDQDETDWIFTLEKVLNT